MQQFDKKSISIDIKNVTMFMVFVIISAAVLRFIVGVSHINTYDTFWYKRWALDLPNGIFDVYARADSISLDYPPVYLFFLYLTGLGYKVIGTDPHIYTQMFLMKFWPIVFDVLCVAFLYYMFRKTDIKAGVCAAVLWAVNPSVFFNSTMWGQTDSVMMFLLLLTFYFTYKNRPIAACVVFAIAGMTKYQCLYFTPILLLQIYKDSGLKSLLKSVGAAAISVAIVFLPFMIGGKNPLLFFDVYLGGADKYPYCTLNAFNVYGMFCLNWVEDTFAGCNVLSVVFTVMSVALIIGLYLFGKRRCAFVGGLLFMQCIFMLTTRMHERYQIVVLPFALVAYFLYKIKDFLYLFISLSIITAINQSIVLMRVAHSDYFESGYGAIMMIVSIINFIVFAYSVYVCCKFFLTGEEKEENKNDLLKKEA